MLRNSVLAAFISRRRATSTSSGAAGLASNPVRKCSTARPRPLRGRMNHSQVCPSMTTVAAKGCPPVATDRKGRGSDRGWAGGNSEEIVNPAASPRRNTRAIISLTASARRSPATMLDETMSRTGALRRQWLMTGKIDIRYRRPAPVDQPLRVWGEIARERDGAVDAVGAVELLDGTVLAEARGMFLRMPDALAD